MAFIFYLSSQSGTISASNSLSILILIAKEVLPDTAYPINYLVLYNELFRTLMHSFEFFILTILLMRTIVMQEGNSTRSIIISGAFSFAYSLSDEIHQLFVQGRSFQLYDLALDSIGIISGIALFTLLNIKIVKLTNKRSIVDNRIIVFKAEGKDE